MELIPIPPRFQFLFRFQFLQKHSSKPNATFFSRIPFSFSSTASAMATTGDGRAPYESGGSGDKFRKRPFPPEINEEPQNVSQEPRRNNSTGVSKLSTHQGGNSASIAVTLGKSELEQMLKQMTFTRSESQHLIELLHLRTAKESPSDNLVVERDAPPSSSSPLLRIEASTSGSLKKQKHKHGDERNNFHAASVSSKVLEDQIVSPAELVNAYKGGTIGTSQAPGQYTKLINNNATCLPKTPQHPTTLENLPGELLSKIFIRLLAKQLAQMRSVSKSWNILLSRSSFIKSHLERSIHNNDQILLVFYDVYSRHNVIRLTTHSCQYPHLKLTNFIKLPPGNPQPENSTIRIIGSINGLICSLYGDSVIHIWNPSLGAMLTLPAYSMPSRVDDSISIYFRFGFDPKTDDYKVVKLTAITRNSLPTKHDAKWWLDVEIYSMSKGSWELISRRFPSHIKSLFCNDRKVCGDGHDGYLHWVGENMNSQTIVSFDLGSKTFHEIPLPDSIAHQNKVYLTLLGVLDGKFCLMSRVGDDGPREVWVMDEYGVAESWVKRHVFSQFTTVGMYPFGFTSHNEFLYEDESCHFLLYDPVADKVKFLENYGPGKFYVSRIVEYIDSLVWIAWAPALRE